MSPIFMFGEQHPYLTDDLFHKSPIGIREIKFPHPKKIIRIAQLMFLFSFLKLNCINPFL